ncbi:MAG: hypothetical protein QM692_21095, partial [Thermomicrobiales bacterium]
RYLRGFAEEIAAGTLSEAQVAARTQLYLASATQAYERGRAAGCVGLELPCYPADGGTRCLTNCRCHWDIKETADAWSAYYRTNAGETCPDCQARAARYNPYVQQKALEAAA